MRKLRVAVGEVVVHVELLDTPTADAIYEAAPFDSRANTWGEEVYFSTPLQLSEEPDARDVVTPGEIAFWPVGGAIAIGFGRTPMLQGNETRLASPCNVWGKALDDVKRLGAVSSGAAVSVEVVD